MNDDLKMMNSIMAHLPEFFIGSIVGDFRAIYQIEIPEEENGIWHFSIENAEVTVKNRPHPNPDCRLIADVKTMTGIFSGTVNKKKASKEGKLKVEGDFEIARQLGHLFVADEAAGIRKFMELLPQGFLPEKAGDMDAVFQWEISGKNGCTWHFIVKNGTCEGVQGSCHNPDCRFVCSDRTLIDMGSGKLSGTRAFLTRKFQIKGNKRVASKVERVFKKMK